MSTAKYKDSACRVNKIEITDATMSNRGGLLFYLRYLENVQLFALIEKVLKQFRLSSKGKPISFIVRQILAYCIDGSMKAISGFDTLREDDGYAATLEVEKEHLCSSHAIKRFFKKFTLQKSFLLRNILNTLYVWRLSIEQPTVIQLDVDTMVLDNDDAMKREGVSPTYKKKKGFQTLQVTWRGMVVDALFRRGTAHSNHGNDVQHTVKRMVELIRNKYSQNVPIIITSDSGFLDEKNLEYFDKTLKILFVCFGKLYDTVTDFVQGSSREYFSCYDNGRNLWEYLEFGSRLKSWKKLGFIRTIFTRLVSDTNGQMILEFARPDTVLYTNIGSNSALTQALCAGGHKDYTETKGIIELAHSRGSSELTNRSLKDFMTSEQLPFKRFGMNAAYYYLQLIGHLLHQSYKEDVLRDMTPISPTCYPTTFRRIVIDFAAKIVRSGNYVRFQVSRFISARLNILLLWERCNSKEVLPIPIFE